MQTFSETGLKPEILKSLEKMGFETPTPIQAETIPYILESTNDLVALAQTGTGKTAAFGLPVLNKIEPGQKKIQSIVLCPTRELCLQITGDIERFSTNLPITVVPVYGGEPIYRQIGALKKGCEMVVGTPGRVNDLINREKLDLSNVRFLILDEADEMLKMGFKDEMDAILAQTPAMKQTLLFSATMPPDIASMTGRYMNTPHKISVTSQNKTAENIEHHYMLTSPSTTYQALRRYADMHPEIYSIIFCRTRQETKDIADQLIADGYNADSLHGDLSQAQRDQVMGRFRKKHLQILVATDVAARGLDVTELTHVIHYHLPDDPENYVHRSGRTGRAGKSGISMAIITPGEQRKIKILERQIKKSLIRDMVPEGKDVLKKRLTNYLDTMASFDEEKSSFMGEYETLIAEKLGHLSKEELLKKFISHEFAKVKDEYHNSPDLNSNFKYNQQPKGKGQRKGIGRKGNRLSRFSINLGAKNNLRPDLLINIINRHTPEHKIKIGRIDIQNKHTVFEADGNYERELVKAFRKARYKGNSLSVQPFQQR
ncbi:DEAD/DEAH box helicase [Marinilabilia rubra]|uniref:RNA helicase n=1 Tax=Marinilabilia rubra TaxID=2162893 RepID=A0A2U2B6X7_9BACT|nr:DEAD/DEAH box helicase [Marinilabilia rubra]PWD98831.1 DEAD/DEAH box helicase [Marinilabilia rubra]